MYSIANWFQRDWSLNPKWEIEEVGGFSLPSAAGCNACRTRGNLVHYRYPWIDPKTICSPKQLRELAAARKRDIPWDEWIRISKPFRKALAPEWPLSPCTSFGHFSGKVFGVLEDVAFCEDYNLFVRSSICSKMIADGFEFLHFPANLKGRKPLREPYVEVWIPPVAKPVNLKPADYCAECSRATTFLGESIALPRAYANTPAFFPAHHRGFLLLSERFVEWTRENGFTGFTVKPETLSVTWV